jgi:hypothetical protein
MAQDIDGATNAIDDGNDILELTLQGIWGGIFAFASPPPVQRVE